jgi:hypothetical protein
MGHLYLGLTVCDFQAAQEQMSEFIKNATLSILFLHRAIPTRFLEFKTSQDGLKEIVR